tara:strand:- start:45 stop:638 length:594 start_codon:yes stop_codon:yes gene_type:complete
MVVQNVSETVIPEELDRGFQFSGQSLIFSVYDRINVFLQQNFKQGALSPTSPRTEGPDDFGGEISQYRHESTRICSERIEEAEVSCRPIVGRKFGRVLFGIRGSVHGVGANYNRDRVKTGPVLEGRDSNSAEWFQLSQFMPWRLYDMRYTYLNRLGESDVDAFTLQTLAGHSSIVASQRYVHPTPERVEGPMTRFEA